MPYIILEDSKGFKKSHGWEHYPIPNIQVRISPKLNFNKPFEDFKMDNVVTDTLLVFYRDRELAHDVWLYKELT